MHFNADKCKALHIGKQNPMLNYCLNDEVMSSVENDNELGAMFNFSDHIKSFTAKAKSRTAWLFRNFVSREQDTIIHLYKSMIRPHLEYCPQVWSPLSKHGNWSFIMSLESVQRWVTRSTQGMDNLTYRQRLEKLNLTNLHERRMRRDLIEVFKS